MSGSSKEQVKTVCPPDNQPKSYAYHAHDHREVMTFLDTKEEGLSDAEVKIRHTKYGSNRFTEEKKAGLFSTVIKQVRSPLAFVLVIAFAITFILEEYIDAGVIALALGIAVLVGVLQEGKASKAFAKLAKSQTHEATVLRSGGKHLINAEELVVGDIVILQSGMQVPADMRLFRAKQLSINEASLTGEWQAVDKHEQPVPVGTPFAEQASMAWMGTYVAEGYGSGVVTAIGDNTAVGRLASDLKEIDEVKTPLQHEMEKVSKVMLMIIIGLVTLIFIIGLVEGHSLHDMLLMSIAISVASVPEGLPAAVTIILAVGMESLLKRGGLVRNMLAAETLGSTTYVLTDKTGTLTEAKMQVTGVIVPSGEYVSDDNFNSSNEIKELFSVSLCAADAYTEEVAGKKVLRGDPVEKAILKQAKELDITETNSRHRNNRVDYLAFTSEQRYAAGLAEIESGQFVLCVNGAPEMLLQYSSTMLTTEGEVSLSLENIESIGKAIEQETKTGKRLVAVGYKPVSYNDIPEFDPDVLEGLVFAGVLVCEDPVRSGVKEAIAGVQGAGAEVVLITGDNPQTALNIAIQAGVATPESGVLTGKELEDMSDEEILLALENVKVFARVLPKQKMRIAMILQQKGEIVAMTGDGINDAPALRRANIGVAIGSGTEVAKESSDLVLVEDSFATIYSAIEEGRRIIANLRKIVGYLLSTSLSEVTLIGTALLVGAPVPILPAQILWANIIEEGLMSVAYAFEKGEPGAMKRKPQDIHDEGILSRDMLWFIAFVVTVLSMLTITLYLYVRSLHLPIETVRSIMFLSVAIDSLFMSFAFRSLGTPIWRIPLSNNWFFVGSFLLSVLLLVLALTVPFMQYVLSYEPLSWNYIGLVTAFSLASLTVIEIAKWLYFERKD